jgi:uncharacterized pyridoxal phosphate-containing UPF0001 family protein
MIGHLQRNKVKYIVDKVCLIHSVDSLRLAEEISKEACKKNVTVDILVEVNVAGKGNKGKNFNKKFKKPTKKQLKKRKELMKKREELMAKREELMAKRGEMMKKREAEMRDTRKAYNAKLNEILTPEQQKKLKSMRQERKGKKPENRQQR